MSDFIIQNTRGTNKYDISIKIKIYIIINYNCMSIMYIELSKNAAWMCVL